MSKQEYIERKVLVEENIAHGMCGHYWFRMNDEDSKKLCLSTNGPWCYKLSEAVNIPGFVRILWEDHGMLPDHKDAICYSATPKAVLFRVPVVEKNKIGCSYCEGIGYTDNTKTIPCNNCNPKPKATPRCEDCANFILHFNIVKESYREPFEVFDLPVPCCLNLIGDKLHSTKYERTFGKCGVNGDCFVAKGKT